MYALDHFFFFNYSAVFGSRKTNVRTPGKSVQALQEMAWIHARLLRKLPRPIHLLSCLPSGARVVPSRQQGCCCAAGHSSSFTSALHSQDCALCSVDHVFQKDLCVILQRRHCMLSDVYSPPKKTMWRWWTQKLYITKTIGSKADGRNIRAKASAPRRPRFRATARTVSVAFQAVW